VKGSGPTARYAHASAVVGSSIYVLGGRGKKNYYSDFYEFNTETEKWAKLSVSGDPVKPRGGHTLTLVRGKLVLFGGHTDEQYFDRVQVLELDRLRWRTPKTRGPVPAARGGHSAVSLGHYLLLFGGFDGVTYFNDLWVLSTRSFKWTRMETSGIPPSPRSGHTAVKCGDHIFIIAGCDSSEYQHDVNVLAVNSMSWMAAVHAVGVPLEPRFFHTGVAFPGDEYCIYLFGGVGDGVLYKDISILRVPKSATDSKKQRRKHVHGGERLAMSLQLPRRKVGVIDEGESTPTAQQAETSDPSIVCPEPNDFLETYLTAMSKLKKEKDRRIQLGLEVTKLQTRLAESTEREQQLDEALRRARGDLVTVQGTRKRDNFSMDSLKKTINSQKHKIRNLQNEIASFRQRLEIVGDALSKEQVISQSYKQSLFGLQLENQRLQEQQERQDFIRDDQQDTIKSLSKQVQKLKTELGELKRSINLLKGFYLDELTLADLNLLHEALISSLRRVSSHQDALEKRTKKGKSSDEFSGDSLPPDRTLTRLLQNPKEPIDPRRRRRKKNKRKQRLRRLSENAQLPAPTSVLLSVSQQTTGASRGDDTGDESQTDTATYTDTTATTYNDLASDDDLSDMSFRERRNTDDMASSTLLANLQLDTQVKPSDLEFIDLRLSALCMEEDSRVDSTASPSSSQSDDLNLQRTTKPSCSAMTSAQPNSSSSGIAETRSERLDGRFVPNNLENLSLVELHELESFHHDGLRRISNVKVALMQRQIDGLKREKEALRDQVLCIVCADKEISLVLLPCGHRCVCKTCGLILSKCPICRDPIESRVHTF